MDYPELSEIKVANDKDCDEAPMGPVYNQRLLVLVVGVILALNQVSKQVDNLSNQNENNHWLHTIMLLFFSLSLLEIVSAFSRNSLFCDINMLHSSSSLL